MLFCEFVVRDGMDPAVSVSAVSIDGDLASLDAVNVTGQPSAEGDRPVVPVQPDEPPSPPVAPIEPEPEEPRVNYEAQ